jgi:hypothetical protein
MSQYLILIHDDERVWGEMDEATRTRVHGQYMEFGRTNEAKVVGGNALQPTHTATTVRPDGAGGFTVTDGPFAETKEALGGYYLVEADDLDEAIAIAKQIPVQSGGLEVRPVMVFS